MVDNLVIFITILFGMGFLLPIILRKWKPAWKFSLLFALLGSLYSAVTGLCTWLDIIPVSPNLFQVDLGAITEDIPALRWEFHMDTLSAFFCFLIAAFALAVAIYSFDALKADHFKKFKNRIASAFNLFVWSTILVVLTHDAFSLILVLEIMTLAFGYLVLYKHNFYLDEEKVHPVEEEKKENARLAPQVYMMISHTSTAILMIAVLILAIGAGSFSFEQLAVYGKNLGPGLSSIVFLLAFSGLAVRAGFTPAHFWVSLVHPSSPTTTHALSLGIAIKVSIYLMYRFFFQFLAPQPWWGYLVLLAAGITALVNVWYAISSHDLKTALAYHSIENIGIICIGMGVGLIAYKDYPSLAFLGLVASFYHLLNHSVFKGLLYLATGAIDYSTCQVVEFHRLGGLIKIYKVTSALFLVGAFSIVGFPPFNGFISEWLTLQSLFAGLFKFKALFSPGLLVMLAILVMLVLSFALTAFCFYKIAGLTLLGECRTNPKDREKQGWAKSDVPWKMKGVMMAMGIFCLLLGIFPGLVIPALALLVKSLSLPGQLPVISPSWTGLTNMVPGGNGLNMAAILLVALMVLSIPLFIAIRRRKAYRETAVPWNCGAPAQTLPASRFTGSAASFLLRDMLHVFSIRPSRESLPDDKKPHRPASQESPTLPQKLILSHSKDYPQEVIEIFRRFFNYIIKGLLLFSEWFGKKIQNKDIRRYLRYTFIANLIALLLFILWGR